MASYAEKQLFKTRFWKHVWELDPESLRELLEAGNPIGHVNFGFRVPSDHGYPLIDSKFYLTEAHQEQQDDNSLEKHFKKLETAVKRTNVARNFYLKSSDMPAAEIVWKLMKSTEPDTYKKIYGLYEDYAWNNAPTLPNGSTFRREAPQQVLKVLWDYKTREVHPDDYHDKHFEFNHGWIHDLLITNIFGILLGRGELSIEDIEKCQEWGRKNRILLLARYPEHFYKKFQSDGSFADHIIHMISDRVTRKWLWKMRLVKLDPKRWPKLKIIEVPYEDNETESSFGINVSVEGLDDVSVEELQAMYEGHPNNINVHEVELALSDRPAKKAKPGTQ